MFLCLIQHLISSIVYTTSNLQYLGHRFLAISSELPMPYHPPSEQNITYNKTTAFLSKLPGILKYICVIFGKINNNHAINRHLEVISGNINTMLVVINISIK